MRVAIVHYWLVGMRGGEKVIEALCDLFPAADIFTLVYDAAEISDKIKAHRIIPSFLQKIPGGVRRYQSMLPLMPFALESFDLSGYDLVISSESGPAKGIIPPPHAKHICYCHSPMRYIWDHYNQYRSEKGAIARAAMSIFAPPLRVWDVTAAARVDTFVANSHHVQRRIHRYYNREAEVIHPPVSVERFSVATEPGDFYLCAGQIVGYKRVDLAIQALTELDRPLVVIGSGVTDRLRKLAGPKVTFLGKQPDSVLYDHFARCRALIFPGEEDFGIVPVEVMASGRPVIAYGRGGALETVAPGRSGILFPEQTVESLKAAVMQFEATTDAFPPEALQGHAALFSAGIFKQKFSDLVDRVMAQ
jgi:glycosyltransferase involved in cell wall biosynthesis